MFVVHITYWHILYMCTVGIFRWTAGGWEVVGSEAGVLARGEAAGWRTGEDILVWGGYDWQGENEITDARLINIDLVTNGEYKDNEISF